MRAFVCALLVACGGASGPATVTVTQLPSAPRAIEPAHEDCRIAGSGDRVRDSTDIAPFEIFSSRHGRDVVLLIAETSEAHVTWSQFPFPTQERRARAEIGGQQHIRYVGYAGLGGRTFTLTKRFAAEPGHLWARAGAPVEVLAFEGASIVASVETRFASPTTLAVRGACDAIAYVPSEPEIPAEKSVTTIGAVVSVSPRIDLHASPSEKPFTTLSPAPNENLSFDLIARAGAFSHVIATVDDIEIDAWVPSIQVDENAMGTMSGYGMSGSSRCGGGSSERGTLAHDSQLFVGATPSVVDGAFVEKGAFINVESSNAVEVQGHVVVPFTFVDAMIEAPGDSRFWVQKDAIE